MKSCSSPGNRPVTHTRPALPVSGDDGREALAVALTIVHDIEQSFPSLSGAGPAVAIAAALKATEKGGGGA